MTERWWSVHVEADVEPTSEEVVEDLLDVLPDVGGSSPALSWSDHELTATVSVRAGEAADAVRLGQHAFLMATEKLGIGIRELYRAEAVTDGRLQAELEQEPEAFVGVSEIAEILGVSKQRVSELRSRPDFPAPIAELAAGPVWRLSNLQRFVAEWPRRPGRPGAMAQAIEELRARGELAAPDGLDLTEAQRQVLGWMAEGATTKQIADELGLSDEAVRSHIRRLFAKLGFASKLEVHSELPFEPVGQSSETPARSR